MSQPRRVKCADCGRPVRLDRQRPDAPDGAYTEETDALGHTSFWCRECAIALEVGVWGFSSARSVVGL